MLKRFGFPLALRARAQLTPHRRDSEIRERQLRTFADVPPSLIFQRSEFDSGSSTDAEVYERLLVRLEHLENIFVVDRLLSRRGHNNHSDLLVTSFDMVALTLLLWKNKDRFAFARLDFPCLVWSLVLPKRSLC